MIGILSVQDFDVFQLHVLCVGHFEESGCHLQQIFGHFLRHCVVENIVKDTMSGQV